MIFKFKQANDEPVPVDVSQNISAEQLKTVLMAKLNFPKGVYFFCYNGKVLPQNAPLSNLPEGATIICAIKQNHNMAIPKPRKIYKFDTREIVNIESNPQETLHLAAKIQGVPYGSKIEAPETKISISHKEFRDLSKDEKKMIKDVANMLNLDKVYSNSFWDYPEAAAEFSKAVAATPDNIEIIQEFVKEHFSSSIFTSPTSNLITPVLFSGVQVPHRVDIIDDFTGTFLCLTNKQKDDFNSLMRVLGGKFDKNKALNSFVKNEYDVEKTLNELKK